jgi:hypothetical protein
MVIFHSYVSLPEGKWQKWSKHGQHHTSPISHEYHDRNYMEWYPHEVLSIEAPEMHSTYHHMTCNEYPKVKTKTIPKVRKIYTYIYMILYIYNLYNGTHPIAKSSIFFCKSYPAPTWRRLSLGLWLLSESGIGASVLWTLRPYQNQL